VVHLGPVVVLGVGWKGVKKPGNLPWGVRGMLTSFWKGSSSTGTIVTSSFVVFPPAEGTGLCLGEGTKEGFGSFLFMLVCWKLDCYFQVAAAFYPCFDMRINN